MPGYTLQDEVVVTVPRKPKVVFGLRKKLMKIDSDGGQTWDYRISIVQNAELAMPREVVVWQCNDRGINEMRGVELSSEQRSFSGQV